MYSSVGFKKLYAAASFCMHVIVAGHLLETLNVRYVCWVTVQQTVFFLILTVVESQRNSPSIKWGSLIFRVSGMIQEHNNRLSKLS